MTNDLGAARGAAAALEAPADPWHPVAEEWRRRDDEQLRELMLSRADDEAAVAADIATLHEDDSDPAHSGAIDAAVSRLLDLDADLGAALVYLQCLVMWERSDDERQITAVADALGRSAGAEASPIVQAAIELARSLHAQLQAENAVFCSCPVALAEHSTAVLAHVERARQALESTASDPARGEGGLVGVLETDTRVLRTYYGAMQRVAAATGCWIEKRSASKGELEAAIAHLRRAEEDITPDGFTTPDVFESELRSHRVGLETMARRAGEAELWLDRGRIVYLYPFGLPHEDAEALVGAVYDGSRRPTHLGRGRVLWVDQAIVAGSWQQDHLVGIPNELVTIARQPLILTTTAGEEVAELRPEVRLSSAGNHLLRIEADVDDLSPHELDQHVRRIGQEMGAERIRLRDGDADACPWRTLPSYATEVLHELAEHLRTTPGGPAPAAAHEVELDVLVASHVLISARHLSVRKPYEEPRPCEVSEIADHLGASILLQPGREQPSSIESWTRRRVTSVVNLLAEDGRDDELLARTHGTTLVYMPTAAEWQVAICDEMAEFSASLAGLLHSWSSHLSSHARKAGAELDAMQGSTEVRARLRTLSREFSRVQTTLTQLRSANVCRLPGDRALLDRLRHAAQIDELERVVHEATGVVVAQQARLSEEAERIRFDHERREAEAARDAARGRRVLRRNLELGVGLLAFTSIFQMANEAHDVSGALVPWGEIVVLVAGTAFFSHWVNKKHEDDLDL